MSKRELTRDQISLLLFVETCAVDRQGLIIGSKLNRADYDNLRLWREDGFVLSGRIPFKEIKWSADTAVTHWAALSDEAWAAAHALRLAKARRNPCIYAPTEQLTPAQRQYDHLVDDGVWPEPGEESK